MTQIDLRRWTQNDDGTWSYKSGDKLQGFVCVTYAGTICFQGPNGRGTAETIAGAKTAVEDMFNADSSFSKMIRKARRQLGGF